MKKKFIYIFFVIFFLNMSVLTPAFAYDSAKIVQKNGKYHLIKRGRVILKNYEKIVKIDDTKEVFYYVEMNGKCGILHSDTSVLFPVSYDSIESAVKNCFIVESNGKVGLYDFENKKWLILPQNDKITLTTNNLFIVRKNNKFGLYSGDDKKWVLDLNFDIIAYEHNNFYVRRYGYDAILNQFLKVLIPPLYDEIEYDENRQIYYVNKNNSWGIADLDGTFLLLPMYQDIFPIEYNSGFAGYAVRFGSKYGLVDSNYKQSAFCLYDRIERLSEYDDEYLKVKKKDKFGILKYNGSNVAKCKYDEILLLKNKNISEDENNIYLYNSKEKDYVFLYKEENLWGVLDLNGNEIVFPNYQEIYSYFYNKDTRAFVVKRNNRYGILEVKDGNQIFKYVNKSLEDITFELKSKIVKQNPLFKSL